MSAVLLNSSILQPIEELFRLMTNSPSQMPLLNLILSSLIILIPFILRVKAVQDYVDELTEAAANWIIHRYGPNQKLITGLENLDSTGSFFGPGNQAKFEKGDAGFKEVVTYLQNESLPGGQSLCPDDNVLRFERVLFGIAETGDRMEKYRTIVEQTGRNRNEVPVDTEEIHAVLDDGRKVITRGPGHVYRAVSPLNHKYEDRKKKIRNQIETILIVVIAILLVIANAVVYYL